MSNDTMSIDGTSVSHALIAVAIQVLVGLLASNWWLGGALACCWWIAREHTQAEYRWIERFGHGQRANMPQWGGFDPRVWTLGSVLDWVIPPAACLVVFWCTRPG